MKIINDDGRMYLKIDEKTGKVKLILSPKKEEIQKKIIPIKKENVFIHFIKKIKAWFSK